MQVRPVYSAVYSTSLLYVQRLAVEMLCCQLDTTWQYFTNTFKMQVPNPLCKVPDRQNFELINL